MLLLSHAAKGGGEMATQPKVVFSVRDVGCGDIGYYGVLVPTPRIDALAAEGTRFKNNNVEAQCTPTRSALLTGRQPIRTGNRGVALPGQGDYGLVHWEYTLGDPNIKPGQDFTGYQCGGPGDSSCGSAGG
jgi:arylsulfatase A-like enzyme